MEPTQQKHRHTSTHEFFQSLNQLKEILEVGENQEPTVPETTDSRALEEHQQTPPSPIALQGLEEAVADIEQYLNDKL